MNEVQRFGMRQTQHTEGQAMAKCLKIGFMMNGNEISLR